MYSESKKTIIHALMHEAAANGYTEGLTGKTSFEVYDSLTEEERLIVEDHRVSGFNRGVEVRRLIDRDRDEPDRERGA